MRNFFSLRITNYALLLGARVNILPGVTIGENAIVGTPNVRHIEEAVSALDITLDDETIKKLEALYVPHIKTGAF